MIIEAILSILWPENFDPFSLYQGITRQNTSISLLNAFLIFFEYAFAGWLLEVCYQFYKKRGFINRGFLSGPYCPMYGAGAVIIIFFHEYLSTFLAIEGFAYFIASFLLAALLATLVELVTGLIILKIYHIRLWDYSGEPYNYKGLICLKFSLYWGALAFILVDVLNRFYLDLLKTMPLTLKVILVGLFSLTLFSDFIFNMTQTYHFSRAIRDFHPAHFPEFLHKTRHMNRIVLNYIHTIRNKEMKTRIKLKQRFENFAGNLQK